MAIAKTLQEYLRKQGISYEVLTHSHTTSSMKTAEAAHIPGGELAKTVVLKDDKGYLTVVLPSTRQLDVGALNSHLKRRLRLATEQELSALFRDCKLGAVPPVGAAYGIETLLDDSLTEEADIYFEAGDHEEVIHVSRDQFMGLLGYVKHGHFSHHA